MNHNRDLQQLFLSKEPTIDIHKNIKDIYRVVEAFIKAEKRINVIYGGINNFDPIWIRPVPNTNIKLILSYDKEFMVFKMKYTGPAITYSETIMSKDIMQTRSEFVKYVTTLFIKSVYQYKFDNINDILEPGKIRFYNLSKTRRKLSK